VTPSPDILSDQPLSQALEQNLWKRFKCQGDMAAREHLITHYMGFARIMAARCYAIRYRDGIGFNDYLQYGSIGLIEAVDRFLPDDGRASFKTYAAHRIRGAILNGLGRDSEVNAQLAAQHRIRQDRLESLAEREPDAPDQPDPLSNMARMAVSMAVGFMLEDERQRRGLEGAAEDDCYANSQVRRIRKKLLDLVDKLPTRERALITAHYFEDRLFEEIAVDMQVSKGRISQLHKKALNTLLDNFGPGRYVDWSV
jgi:RNA polymerase sigma factor for flagellar operon FliA